MQQCETAAIVVHNIANGPQDLVDPVFACMHSFFFFTLDNDGMSVHAHTAHNLTQSASSNHSTLVNKQL